MNKNNMSAADEMFASASEKLGRPAFANPQEFAEGFQQLPEDVQRAFLSLYRITTVIESKKDGRKLDYNNRGQRKYYPWWDMETYGDDVPGSGFALYGVVYHDTGTHVGARLSAETDSDARSIAAAMIEDYKNWCKE